MRAILLGFACAAAVAVQVSKAEAFALGSRRNCSPSWRCGDGRGSERVENMNEDRRFSPAWGGGGVDRTNPFANPGRFGR